MIFGGRLKNFFDWLELYLDKIPVRVFILLGLTALAIVVVKKVIQGPVVLGAGQKFPWSRWTKFTSSTTESAPGVTGSIFRNLTRRFFKFSGADFSFALFY